MILLELKKNRIIFLVKIKKGAKEPHKESSKSEGKSRINHLFNAWMTPPETIATLMEKQRLSFLRFFGGAIDANRAVIKSPKRSCLLGCPRNVVNTLQETNIAGWKNGPLEDVLPIKTWGY